MTTSRQSARHSSAVGCCSQDEINKPVRIISGGEQGRMLFGKLILQRPNVLVMDEPTNHLDMESIESLANSALENYPIADFRQPRPRIRFRRSPPASSSLTPKGVVNFNGSYDDYPHSQGVEAAPRRAAD